MKASLIINFHLICINAYCSAILTGDQLVSALFNYVGTKEITYTSVHN